MSHDEKRFDTARKGFLVSAERTERWDPPRFLARFGLQPGQVVLDLGSEPGFWTLPLAHIVGPEGKVWALDVSQELLDDLASRNPPPQVELLRSDLPHIGLPDAMVEFAWAAFVFHEVEPPDLLAAELRRVVRAGGRIAVLDWRPDAPTEVGPPRHHLLRPEQVINWLEGAGFLGSTITWQDDDCYLVQAG